MLTTALTVIKKFFGISTDVREATKRPLEEESENEFEEVILHDTEPQKKKRCSYVDYLLTSSNNTPGFSPVLMQFPWLTGRKENPNKVSDVKMNSHKNQQQKEGCGAEATVIEERVKKWSAPFPCSTSLSVSCTSELENDFEAMEMRKARSVGELATCCHPPAHSSLADFRFVPSSSGSVQSDFPAKQKSRNSDCLSSSRNHKSKMKKSGFKGPPTTVLERPLGKKKSSSFLSSRIKHSLVHKSFLHEEKMKYRQLLQQYIDHYWTPNSKVLSHKVSSLPSLPVGMVTRSHWTPFLTKKKQEEIENKSSNPSSLRLLPYADNSVLEEVMGKKKIVGLDENLEKYEKQKKSSSIHVLLVDLSKEDNEEQNTCDRESDSDSVIMIKEMLSPRAQRNSLEERFKEHPLYDLEWVKTMQKEYEDRAYNAQKNANTTSELIQELQQRRNKKVSLHEKVTQGLKLLDLTYPSKYTEVQLPDEEEEEILVPLTPEMENEIDDALNKIPQSEVLIEKFHIQITRRDIKTLDGLNWLNDEVINFYMNLLMERSQKNDSYPRVYAFNTFFYPKLSKSGYHSVRRWTKKVDLFSYDMLLVPIHLGMHWCMSVVDFKTKCISYYDSMLHNNEWCLESLLEYLKAEHQDKKGSSYDTDVWKLQNKKDIPQQMNGSDCGMFACKFADYLSRRAKIKFDQQHMPYFRRRMVYEIINAKLL
uniref:Ubiquitin-like protease family profile domain-containing protein n=1 Tax=Scylla olivacea TaxID=85551 RepID=A0A0P4WT40_SCYOL